MKYTISVRRVTISNCVSNHLPHNYWNLYGYLIHCQNEDFKSYYLLFKLVSPILLMIEPGMVKNSGTSSPRLQSLLDTCFLVQFLESTYDHAPLKYRFSFKINNQVRPALP